jgi:hypothetical protein
MKKFKEFFIALIFYLFTFSLSWSVSNICFLTDSDIVLMSVFMILLARISHVIYAFSFLRNDLIDL